MWHFGADFPAIVVDRGNNWDLETSGETAAVEHMRSG
jgi:hypothetical protein